MGVGERVSADIISNVKMRLHWSTMTNLHLTIYKSFMDRRQEAEPRRQGPFAELCVVQPGGPWEV